MENPMIKQFVKPKDLAKKWGCSRNHIIDIARREGIPVLTLGHRTARFLSEDVERLQNILIERATKKGAR